METYSSSHTAAQDPEERVQLNKPNIRQYAKLTKRKIENAKIEKRAEKTTNWPRMIKTSRQQPKY